MKITTERLTIRLLQRSDARFLQALWTDFNASLYRQYDVPHDTEWKEVRSLTDICTFLSRFSEEYRFFVVCLDGTKIGIITTVRKDNDTEIGYTFLSAFHNNGYAKESISALLKELAGHGQTSFIAGTALKNTPSVALLKSLGFTLYKREPTSFHTDENGEPVYFEGGWFRKDIQS